MARIKKGFFGRDRSVFSIFGMRAIRDQLRLTLSSVSDSPSSVIVLYLTRPLAMEPTTSSPVHRTNPQ